jgi:hypothetical protein
MAVAIVLLSACGRVDGAGAPAQGVDPISPPTTSSTAGLDRWEGFSAAKQPRPIVFLSGPLHWPDNGFVNDSEKIALSYGRVSPRPATPKGLTRPVALI